MTPDAFSPEEILPGRELAYRDGLDRWPAAEALRASIRRRGLLQPLLLRRQEGGLQVVAGFRRWEVLREEAAPRIPGIIVSGAPDALFLDAVESHAGQEPNLRERARAIQVSRELGWSLERIAEQLLPALGLGPQPHLAAAHLQVLALPGELLDLLVQKRFSLRRCLPFCHLEAAMARLLAETARIQGLGGRQLEEVCTCLLEIAAREGRSPGEVARELHLQEPPGPGGAAAILERLARRRLPELHRRRDALEALGRELVAGREGLAVRWEPHLGREEVELVLSLASVARLRELLQHLGREEVATGLAQMLARL